MKILISPTKPTNNPENIKTDLWLFSELCNAYSQYYGARYSKDVKDKWNAAFLVYSGYQELYKNPNLYRSIVSIAGENLMPKVYCFEQIIRSLEANKVSLSHSITARAGKPGHPPVPDDISAEALEFFRAKLEENEKLRGNKSLLSRYCNFLMNPYSHQGIKDFLWDASKELLPTPKDMKEYEYQEHLCIKYGLYDPNGTSDMAQLLKAAIEFSLRNVLEQRCAYRLYGWLTSYIDYLCKDAAI